MFVIDKDKDIFPQIYEYAIDQIQIRKTNSLLIFITMIFY